MRKKVFKNLLPKFRLMVYQVIKKKMIRVRTKEFDLLPVPQVKEKHICNAQMLVSRMELLMRLPKSGVVAELGVDEGFFSDDILKICNPKKLHLIDFWGTTRYNSEKKKRVVNRFKAEIEAKKIEINIGFSTKVVEQFPDSYFDWIYIDTDHSYETTKSELEKFQRKMKPEGIIAGHDFIVGNWRGIVLYGVIQAVYEFCDKYDWEIIYLTVDLDTAPSFAIKRIM